MFWKLTPKEVTFFVKAYEIKKKNEIEKINFSSWINGIYISHAIASVLGDNNKYPGKPFELFNENKEEEVKNNEEIFSAYVTMFNNEFEKKAK
ncbi:hypothetical protein [Anaerofustis butyriciformans]|uniref:hypothetical protein n=1 Tax=Anaerofustis butyriciformans TaxID=3108533 RepID=UPI002E3665EF|nr:hypothetical protein [Anaerofustis sp. HA2171]